jgi:SAM-dependent methyltransferase
MTKSLDLGSGPSPNNPYNADEVFGIDIRADLGANIFAVDLTLSGIPFNNDYFEYVTAFQFIEHIPRVIYAPEKRNPFIELMNEIYRVLKPGGIFLSVTPAYPHPAAFQDPTHVNIITEETFTKYFDDTHTWAKIYGFKGRFKILQQEWSGANLITQIKKI